jgi:mRNA interferase MazF
MHPQRGEVWWVWFDPSVGGEIEKPCPAIVLSNNSANAALNRVIVVPTSSQTSKVYPARSIPQDLARRSTDHSMVSSAKPGPTRS